MRLRCLKSFEKGSVPVVSSADEEKRLAAEAAAELVESGMTVGLGTGSTVAHLLPAIARRGLDGIRCVATPIWDRTGRVTAALSVSGASFRMVGDHLDSSREACMAATRLMSLRLGADVEDLVHAAPVSE